MNKFELLKEGGRMYIRFKEWGLISEGGFPFNSNYWYILRQSDEEGYLYLADKLVQKKELHDFLRDEGKKFVSGLRGNSSSQQFKPSARGMWEQIPTRVRYGNYGFRSV